MAAVEVRPVKEVLPKMAVEALHFGAEEVLFRLKLRSWLEGAAAESEPLMLLLGAGAV